jgi:hypothetical protein
VLDVGVPPEGDELDLFPVDVEPGRRCNDSECTVQGWELLPELIEREGEVVGVTKDVVPHIHCCPVECITKADKDRVEGQCEQRA